MGVVDGLLATIKYVIARFGEMAKVMSTEVSPTPMEIPVLAPM
jgi:hypothetical protein